MGRHLRLSRVYGGIAARNAMDCTGDSSVVSTSATFTSTDSAADNFVFDTEVNCIVICYIKGH